MRNNILGKDNEILMQFIRFGIVGLTSTVATYLTYYLLLKVINPSISYTIGYIVGFIINYILTIVFTFKVKSSTKKGIGFILSHIINYLLSLALLNILIEFGIDKKWALIPVQIICIPVNFILVRYFVKIR